jgi:hypothetical protein
MSNLGIADSSSGGGKGLTNEKSVRDLMIKQRV